MTTSCNITCGLYLLFSWKTNLIIISILYVFNVYSINKPTSEWTLIFIYLSQYACELLSLRLIKYLNKLVLEMNATSLLG